MSIDIVELGPVDQIVVEFPEGRFTVATVRIQRDLVGPVRENHRTRPPVLPARPTNRPP